jgi:hypothetical protein
MKFLSGDVWYNIIIFRSLFKCGKGKVSALEKKPEYRIKAGNRLVAGPL